MEKRTIIEYNFLKEPVIREFLSSPENSQLFYSFLDNPSSRNEQLLDSEFRKFYQDKRVMKYITTTIKQYSIDFDKKNRTRRRKDLCILDQPVNNEEESEDSIKTNIQDNTISDPADEMLGNLRSSIADPALFEEYERLTDMQKKILHLIYIEQLSLQDVATFFNVSRQNIYNIHKRILMKFKKVLKNY